MKNLPTLYKQSSKGADQFWTIGTDKNTIVTRWGYLGGKEQETRDEVKEGKNVGKKNETTPEFQAQQEAMSQWTKKLKKGYVRDLKTAQAGEVDEIIQGGVAPMLAHRFDEHGHKIKFPALAQPKLDGHRCIAVVKDGKATLWSRTRKPITGLPHINWALEAFAATLPDHFGSEYICKGNICKGNVTLDGELYNHAYKDRFEDLTSFIRTPEPQPGHEVVQYHVYDVVDFDLHQGARLGVLHGAQESFGHPLVRVETIAVQDEDEMMNAFDHFLSQGYEGLMVKNALGAYEEDKRSYDLQKVKEFNDAEFEIVGVEEGRGKLAGKAIFVCVTANKEYPNGKKTTLLRGGDRFNVKMKGKLEDLRKYLDDPSLAVGKLLNVQYQGITNKKFVPRFPVGIRFWEEV